MDKLAGNDLSDRAALTYELGIADGIFGDKIEVVADEEGLEFGGYSTLPWVWIDRVRAILHAADKAEFEGPSSHTSCDENGVPS